MALTFEGAQSSVNLAIYVDRKFFNRHQRHLGCIYLGVDGSHYFSGKESDFFPCELEQIKQKLSELNARQDSFIRGVNMESEFRVKDFQPKDGMCGTCVNRDSDCSQLDFENMPILSIDLEEIIVRCTEFRRA